MNYTKTTVVEKSLQGLFELLSKIPPQTVNTSSSSHYKVTSENATFPSISLENEVDSLNLRFNPPKVDQVALVGSYLLQTVTKPILNVDVAVEIPKVLKHFPLILQTCLKDRDIKNYRYLDKRALYLGVLAKALQGHPIFGNLSFSFFKGDPRKPFLIIKPRKGISFLPSHSRSRNECVHKVCYSRLSCPSSKCL